ncbi:unnamed protein product [Protopolystoma xenopodis]|uniref:Uncharacterized protein n=1 Tax=Protopolystoma xenopodis TaxID=117903 RepID=A0A3S5B662_9PLAT|nr:unnamed protein product [Protopolystoma xenopodis]
MLPKDVSLQMDLGKRDHFHHQFLMPHVGHLTKLFDANHSSVVAEYVATSRSNLIAPKTDLLDSDLQTSSFKSLQLTADLTHESADKGLAEDVQPILSPAAGSRSCCQSRCAAHHHCREACTQWIDGLRISSSCICPIACFIGKKGQLTTQPPSQLSPPITADPCRQRGIWLFGRPASEHQAALVVHRLQQAGFMVIQWDQLASMRRSRPRLFERKSFFTSDSLISSTAFSSSSSSFSSCSSASDPSFRLQTSSLCLPSYHLGKIDQRIHSAKNKSLTFSEPALIGLRFSDEGSLSLKGEENLTKNPNLSHSHFERFVTLRTEDEFRQSSSRDDKGLGEVEGKVKDENDGYEDDSYVKIYGKSYKHNAIRLYDLKGSIMPLNESRAHPHSCLSAASTSKQSAPQSEIFSGSCSQLVIFFISSASFALKSQLMHLNRFV